MNDEHLATIEWSGILLAGDGQTVKKSNTFNGTSSAKQCKNVGKF